MTNRGRLALLAILTLVIAACAGGGGSSPRTTGGGTSPATSAGASGTAAASPSAAATATAAATDAGSPSGSAAASGSPAASGSAGAGDPNDLLAQIRQRGTLRVSTDPKYPPQSFLRPDGTFEGFDIDVANEIGKRLGVSVAFETPTFEAVTGGDWAGRWDISVGSVTVTPEREEILDFTQPYYFTPAQLAATTQSGITTIEGLAGKTVCTGAGTTYFQWLNGELEFGGDAPAPAPAPEGVQATTFETDTDCAEAVRGGRTEFEGWLTSSTTLTNSIENGDPFVAVGEPVFFEPLAVAMAKNGPPHAELQAELDRIVGEMHADGTLTRFSQKWFGGIDLTKRQ